MHCYDIACLPEYRGQKKISYDVISTEETISNHYRAKEVLSRVTVFEMDYFSPDLSLGYNTILMACYNALY